MSNSAPNAAAGPEVPPIGERAIGAWTRWCRLRGHPLPRREDWQVLASTGEAEEARVVLRLGAGADALVLKARPGLPIRRLIGTVRAQRRCQRLLARSQDARVPRVVGVLPSQRILAMEAAPGRPAVDLAWARMARSESVFEILKRCGAWARTLHAAAPSGAVPFGSVASSRLDMAARDGMQMDGQTSFAAALDRAQAGIAALGGRRLPRVVSHGDLHMGNMMLDPAGTVWGIDFESSGLRPAVEDLARLLAHFVVTTGPEQREDMGPFLVRSLEVLSDEGGYGPTEFDYLLRLRLLIEALVFWGESSNPEALARPDGRRRAARAAALARRLSD